MLMDDYGDDEPERVAESIDWGQHIDTTKTNVNQNPSGAYNKLSEALRQNFPHEATCSMFCRGKKCKYCCDDNWKEDEQAIKGLYSHWVTDNILACSRPITRLVEKYNIITQFNQAGINAIINVQLPNEHIACGDGVHDGEFSYRQQDFMDKGVFFYNFGWKDFGVAESMTFLLDMVKVMQFAISQGKVAVHCHAGKGRTGVLICCFLVFHNRMTANEAVHYMRSKRPGSVQTGPQVACVQEFERFLKPYRVVFSEHADIASFNLTQYLTRQKGIMHGYQARKLKFLPKIIYIICERLLKLAKKGELLHIPSSTSMSVEFETSPGALRANDNKPSTDHEVDDPVLNPKLNHHQPHQHSSAIHGKGQVSKEVHHIGEALANEHTSEEVKNRVVTLEKRLNEDDSAWDELREEKDANVLTKLLWNWLDQLKDPVVRRQDTDLLFDNVEQPQIALDRLDKGTRFTITYLMEFLVKLQPIEEDLECRILQRLISVLTHKTLESQQLQSISAQSLSDVEDLRSSINSLTEMKDVEKLGIFKFFYNLLEVLEDAMAKKT